MEVTYQDPKQAASFGGVDALYRAARGKVPKKEIRKWLEGVDTYTLHKPARRKFPTNRVIVYSIDQQWQADLVDLKNLSKHNRGYNYLLTCIDILSKYAWAVPLKTKRGVETVKAFETIFAQRKPQSLQSDKGTEFKNTTFQSFLKQNGVRFFTTFNETKASVVERFNRTLKTKMWKYFTNHRTYQYVDVLDKLLHSYNHTYHSSIKRAPAEVTVQNERDVWLTLYGKMEDVKTKPCVFQVGDTVRVSKHKLTFEKGYETNWSEELFVVTECVPRHPPVYRIKDLMNEPIEGTFYAQELQRVAPKDNYTVEKILKKRSRNGRVEYWVKFRGYPSKFNQWIPSTDMFKL
ncbi:hypothetical protein RF55_23325 [Lasius niger]|uniref:Integrase catalytic domain-containing protein n=1 Tax=Lasius niger TaxID=67767 RepID=A0A0J7JWN9_LASNI|nr:hypothetical protein RF55_23325 [Lasius niger]